MPYKWSELPQNSSSVGRGREGVTHPLPSPVGQSLPTFLCTSRLYQLVLPEPLWKLGPMRATAFPHPIGPGPGAMCVNTRRPSWHLIPQRLKQSLLQVAESSGGRWKEGGKMLSGMSIMTSVSRSSSYSMPSWPGIQTDTMNTDEPSTYKDPELSLWPTRQYWVLGKFPVGHEQKETAIELGCMDPVCCLSRESFYFHLGWSSQ